MRKIEKNNLATITEGTFTIKDNFYKGLYDNKYTKGKKNYRR
jgi:hypothetical protein